MGDIDEMMRHVIDRFTPDELCEILDLRIETFVDRFYDEIISHPDVRLALGYTEDADGYEPED